MARSEYRDSMPTVDALQGGAGDQITDEHFQAMPPNFSEYVASHPEVLPDYTAFADEVMADVAAKGPNVVLGLHGPQGIGKTRLLIPTLRRAAASRNLTDLGSLGGMHNRQFQLHLDSSDWLTDKGFEVPPGAFIYSVRKWGRSRLRRELEARFSDSGGSGLFILDEFAHISEVYPDLVINLGRLAKSHGVTLAAITPLVDTANGTEEEMKERLEVAFEDLCRLSILVGRTVVPRGIDEQLVPLSAIPEILRTYGINQELTSAFSANPHLRRLQVIEELVNDLFAYRKEQWPGNRLILGSSELKALHAIKLAGDPDRHYHPLKAEDRSGNLGLTLGAHAMMLSELFASDPIEIEKRLAGVRIA